MDDVVLRTLTAVWGWVCSLTPAHWTMILTGVVVLLTVAVVVYAARTLKAVNKSLAVSRESLAVFVKPRVEICGGNTNCRLNAPAGHHELEARITLTNGSPLPVRVEGWESFVCNAKQPPLGKRPLSDLFIADHSTRTFVSTATFPHVLETSEHAEFALRLDAKLPDGATGASVEVYVEFTYRGEIHRTKTIVIDF